MKLLAKIILCILLFMFGVVGVICWAELIMPGLFMPWLLEKSHMVILYSRLVFSLLLGTVFFYFGYIVRVRHEVDKK